jgi:hypothetical protein
MPLLSWPRPKDPGDLSDYSVDVDGLLNVDGNTGDMIATATWTVPSGLAKVLQAESGTLAKIWLSGGTPGTMYTLNLIIVSQGGNSGQGRTFNMDLRLLCDERGGSRL